MRGKFETNYVVLFFFKTDDVFFIYDSSWDADSHHKTWGEDSHFLPVDIYLA